ncbi:MAG: sulfatase-like hydrolase/transferase [Proteobacteria bacterium]|nr:sulfatase-like hydrolase/transferase [Pseudomonadota bacterium]
MQTSSPNILFLMSDEHQAGALSYLSHPIVKTPNLDNLAARGVLFKNAYTPSPICVPARASLATGEYVHQCRYWDNALAYDGVVQGWGHLLQHQGISTTSIGKLHYRNATDPTGFDHQILPLHIKDGIGQVWGSVRNPLPEKPRTEKMLPEIGEGTSKYNIYDQKVADETIGWLGDSNNHNAPWLLFSSFVAPHFPLIVPKKYLDLYKSEEMPSPLLRPDDGHPLHPWVERMSKFQNNDIEFDSNGERKLAIAAYFALCTFMDEQIGRILEALEASGQAENTIIIYTSDHGETLGMRGRWGKQVLYRESTQIPLIMAGPGLPEGLQKETAVNLLDLPPTICDHFNVEVPKKWTGRSLFDIQSKPDDHERISFSEYHAVASPSGGFMVANANYKYHYYVGYEPELFHLDIDPLESNNLAGNPEYKEIEKKMHTALLDICNPDRVDQLAKADQQILIDKWGGPDAALKIGPTSASPVPI